jgi:hypothetical protein
MTNMQSTIVKVKRTWNDWRVSEVELSDLSNLHWDRYSGGVKAPCPQYFIHGYIMCDKCKGNLVHSCMHGPSPHLIKVCMTKTDNPKIFPILNKIAGPKPVYYKL